VREDREREKGERKGKKKKKKFLCPFQAKNSPFCFVVVLIAPVRSEGEKGKEKKGKSAAGLVLSLFKPTLFPHRRTG